MELNNLTQELKTIKALAYDKCSLVISNLILEAEGKEYKACQFKLNDSIVICRSAKITAKKNGQFVTFWKRNKAGITEPFDETDKLDFYVVNVTKGDRIGQFVFPKQALIKNGIISSSTKEGKRGFRVYPIWDVPQSKQAIKTQTWQLNYFIELDDKLDVVAFKKLYKTVHKELD